MQRQISRSHWSLLSGAAVLLVRNPRIFAPALWLWVAAAAVFGAAFFMREGYQVVPLLVVLGALIAVPVVIAFTIGMAGAAWRTGHATLADGAFACSQSWVSLLLVIVGIEAVSALLQYALPPSAKVFAGPIVAPFLLYALATVAVGNFPVVEAIVESLRLAGKNVFTTVVVFALALASMLIPALFASISPPSEPAYRTAVGILLMLGMPALLTALYVYAVVYVTGEFLTQHETAL